MSDDTAPSRSGQVDDRLPLLDDQGAVKQADGIVDRPAGTDGTNGDTVPHSPGNGLPPQTLFGVAILILVAFLGLALFMIVNADASDPVWKNRLAIFTTVQAIVYTAVGWLFGREVNRGAKEAAEKSADMAKADADRAKIEAADAKKVERQQAEARTVDLRAASTEKVRGTALAAAVLAGATTDPVPSGIESQSGSATARGNEPFPCGPLPPASIPRWPPDGPARHGDLEGRLWTT